MKSLIITGALAVMGGILIGGFSVWSFVNAKAYKTYCVGRDGEAYCEATDNGGVMVKLFQIP